MIYAAEISPNYALYNLSLPDLSPPDVKSDFSISNLSLKVRCATNHFCWCAILLKYARSFVSYVSSSFAEFRGGPYGSG